MVHGTRRRESGTSPYHLWCTLRHSLAWTAQYVRDSCVYHALWFTEWSPNASHPGQPIQTYLSWGKNPRGPPDAYLDTREVSKLDIGQSEVVANVFMGNERSRIRMSIDGKDDWIDMKREARKDPYLVNRLPSGHAASESKHIWVARLPSDIKAGVHTVRVRSEDMYGQFFEDQRIFRVVSDIPLKPSDVNPNDKPIPGVNPGDSGNLVWTGGSDYWKKMFSEMLSPEVEVSINTPVEVILSSHTRIGALQVSENGVLSIAEGGNLWVKGKPFYIGSGYQQNAVGAGKVHLSQTGICTIESNVVFGDRENSPGTLIASGQSRVNILGGHYLGVRSNGKIIIRNQAVYNVAGKIQFGWGADLGLSLIHI